MTKSGGGGSGGALLSRLVVLRVLRKPLSSENQGPLTEGERERGRERRGGGGISRKEDMHCRKSRTLSFLSPHMRLSVSVPCKLKP